MGKINLESRNFIEYEIIYSPEGKSNILWDEYNSDGKRTGKRGDVIWKKGKYKTAILEDYKKKK